MLGTYSKIQRDADLEWEINETFLLFRDSDKKTGPETQIEKADNDIQRKTGR